MNPLRFRQLAALYLGAAALPAAEQAEWVSAACGEDLELAGELLALLAAGRRPTDPLLASARVQLRAAAQALSGRDGC